MGNRTVFATRPEEDVAIEMRDEVLEGHPVQQHVALVEGCLIADQHDLILNRDFTFCATPLSQQFLSSCLHEKRCSAIETTKSGDARQIRPRGQVVQVGPESAQRG